MHTDTVCDYYRMYHMSQFAERFPAFTHSHYNAKQKKSVVQLLNLQVNMRIICHLVWQGGNIQ